MIRKQHLYPTHQTTTFDRAIPLMIMQLLPFLMYGFHCHFISFGKPVGSLISLTCCLVSFFCPNPQVMQEKAKKKYEVRFVCVTFRGYLYKETDWWACVTVEGKSMHMTHMDTQPTYADTQFTHRHTCSCSYKITDRENQSFSSASWRGWLLRMKKQRKRKRIKIR